MPSMPLLLLATLLPSVSSAVHHATQPRSCQAPTPRADSIMNGVVAAINDGSYKAINDAFERYWNAARIPAQARASIQRDLARYHHLSSRLTPLRFCNAGAATVGAATGSANYAILNNAATGERDSLHFFIGAQGYVGLHRIFHGTLPVAAADTVNNVARAAALRSLTRRLADSGLFSGQVLLARDGKVLYHEALGTANRETGRRVRIDDQFNMASVGKLITGTAIMKLVEDGAMSLDDTLGKFLGPSERPARAGAVMIKHILSHTDGMTRGSDTLAFAPGTNFSYVNYGYYLLGLVIEKVTKQPFASYFERALFRRAGMTNTRELKVDAPDPSLPVAYTFEFDSAGARFVSNPQAQTIAATGAGGLFTTALDLFRFADALRTGKLVSFPSLQTMRAPRKEWGANEYGFGVDWYRGNNIWGHSGYIPGAGADLEIHGDSGWVFVIIGNSEANDIIRRRAGVLIGVQPLCADVSARANRC